MPHFIISMIDNLALALTNSLVQNLASKGKINSFKIGLKYDNGIPALEGFKRVSKPGQRIYAKMHDIKKVKGGFGLSIVSTSKGLMTGGQAKKSKLGGEVLLEVW